MAVHIRLRRIGKHPKKRPYFRITVLDGHKARDGRFIEEIGSYNPVSGAIKLKKERFDLWAKKGAVISGTVQNLIKKLAKEDKNATASTSA